MKPYTTTSNCTSRGSQIDATPIEQSRSKNRRQAEQTLFGIKQCGKNYFTQQSDARCLPHPIPDLSGYLDARTGKEVKTTLWRGESFSESIAVKPGGKKTMVASAKEAAAAMEFFGQQVEGFTFTGDSWCFVLHNAFPEIA